VNTIIAGSKDRDKILAWLDQQRKDVMDALDQGGMVTLHSRTEMKEFQYGLIPFTDFLYEGWTFGVTIGPYPRKGDHERSQRVGI
jgi:hypothetical protein